MPPQAILHLSTPCARRLVEACLPRMAEIMHNSDIIARVLEYACEPKDAAARKWLVSKAWLRAYGAPALWRTLKLTALPADAPVWALPARPAHCTVSLWARAPQRLRTVVERHTRCVDIHDGGHPPRGCILPTTPYTLGSGLAGQDFARLEKVIIRVQIRHSAQSYAADRAALEPLFDVTSLGGGILPWKGNNFLSLERSRDFFQHFHNVRILDLPDKYVPLVFRAELMSEFGHRTNTLLVQDGEEYAYNFLDREQATRLVELSGIRAGSFRHPVPAGLFPHMTNLELCDSHLSIQDLAAVFANVSAACPILELLSLEIDNGRADWCERESYSVFAHAPPRLKALCLMLDSVFRMVPSSCETASQFVALVQGHLPTGVGFHVSSSNKTLEDDGALPVAPWAPAFGPSLGGTYDDAVLARATFTPWNESDSEEEE